MHVVYVCVCVCVFLLERSFRFETGQTGSGLGHRLSHPSPPPQGTVSGLWVRIICFYSSSFPAHFLGGHLHFIINNSGAICCFCPEGPWSQVGPFMTLLQILLLIKLHEATCHFLDPPSKPRESCYIQARNHMTREGKALALSVFLLGKPPWWSWAVSRESRYICLKCILYDFGVVCFLPARKVLFLYLLLKQDFYLVPKLFDKKLPVDANQINGVLICFGF